MTSAETAYLFRHALLRDAAYELQTPGDRAKLHELAFFILEEAFGGRAPALPPLDARAGAPGHHSTDPVAAELAAQAELAIASAATGNRAQLEAARVIYLRRAAELAERRFQHSNATRLWKSLGEILPEAMGGEAVRRAATANLALGAVQEAEVQLNTALLRGTRAGIAVFEMRARTSLGNLYLNTGRLREAKQVLTEAWETARELGDRWAEADLESSIGLAHAHLHESPEALQRYRRAMELHQELSYPRGHAVALLNMALLYQETGKVQDSERLNKLALGMVRELGLRQLEGILLTNLAIVYSVSGRDAEAEDLHRQALEIHVEVGDRRTHGIALGNLAGLLRRSGRAHESESAYTQALSIHVEVGNKRSEGLHRAGYAVLLMEQGEAGAARDQWNRAVAQVRAIGSDSVGSRTIEEMRQACAKAGAAPFDA